MNRLSVGLVMCGLVLAKGVAAQPELAAIDATTYQQYYQGVPIFGAQLKINNTVTTGKTSPAVVLDTTPTITAETAGALAQTLAGQPAATILKSRLYVFDEQLLNKLKPSSAVLVWKIELYQPEPLFHQYYFIDAHSGDLVYQLDGVLDAISRQIYDCSYGILTSDCYIDSTDLSTGYTYGRSEGQAARGANPLNPNVLLTYLTDTDDLYDNLGNIYYYYFNNFGLDGANGNGGMGDGAYFPTTDTTGLTYIDYYYLSESDYTSCPNAFFDGIGSMHYCEGFVTNDISGHEYAHAVNHFSVRDDAGDPAGLAYTNESGALNEASSDVFGEALEYAVTGSNDWLLGADSPVGVLRSMSNPPDYTYTDDDNNAVPYPDRYNSEHLYCGEADSGGVHTNSSVVNKAAYLMAIGGTFNGCTITGIGRAKEEAIFYRAQSTYYTTTTDFNGAYTALLAACRDLYSSTDCKDVEKALRATELDQAGFCSGEPAADPDCADVDALPTITRASSDTANGSYKAGTSIDITVRFSEPVSGDVTVVLETGDTDRQCSFTIDQAANGSCNYRVRAGDTSSDLTIKRITGTITDSSNDAVTATLPTTNLDSNKQLVIDTTKPTVPTRLKIYTAAHKHKRIKTVDPRTYTKIVKAKALRPYLTWRAVPGVSKYFVKFTDHAMTRTKLLRSQNQQTTTNLRGDILTQDKTYYLYMILQDEAGNRSRVKTIVRYRSES